MKKAVLYPNYLFDYRIFFFICIGYNFMYKTEFYMDKFNTLKYAKKEMEFKKSLVKNSF